MKHAVPVFLASLAFTLSASANVNQTYNGLTNGASILGTGPGLGWVGAAGATATVSTNGYSYTADYTTNLSHFVIFEGVISNSFSRIAPDTTGGVGLQMLSKLQWSSEMPAGDWSAGKQGGICVSNGWPFALSSSGWIRLTDTNSVNPITSLASNTWTKLTFLFSYLGGSASGDTSNVFYRVLIDDHSFRPQSESLRYAPGSPLVQNNDGLYLKSPATFSETSPGVSGMTLIGAGAFDEYYAGESTNTTPLSAEISIRAITTTNGLVVVEFTTVDETEQGSPITLYLLTENGPVNVGHVYSQGGSGATYRIVVPGLEAGGTYTFRIIDEGGQPFTSRGVTVGDFSTRMVRMDQGEGITLQWASSEDQRYYIERAARLGEPWERILGPINGSAGDTTSVFVPFASGMDSSFFRIVQE